MKKIVAMVSLVLVSGSSALASDTFVAGQNILNMKCSPKDSQASVFYNIKVTSLVNAENNEDMPIPAKLTFVRLLKVGQEMMVVPKVYQGKYVYEDVVHQFADDNGEASLIFYADEMDQTVLTVKGKDTVFVCEYL